MDAPDRPHVRLFEGNVFIERVPNIWVSVCPLGAWKYLSEKERDVAIQRALKLGEDCELPETTGFTVPND